MALGVLFAGIGVEELLHLRHAAVGLGAEAQLDFNQGFEARVQVGHAQIDESGEFLEQLLVEAFVGGAGGFGFAFGAGEFGGVLVGFFGEFFHSGSRGVVVEEFVVAFFYTCGQALKRGKFLIEKKKRYGKSVFS